jgi:gliding motility-associated-like protein
MRFDNSTGQLSLPIQIPTTTTNLGNTVSFEFSPNSRFLYTIQADSATAPPLPQRVVQYDLQAPNIITSAQTLYSSSLFYFLAGLQLAPDGKIYFINFGVDSLGNIVNNLDRITCPNTTAASIDFDVFTYSNFSNGAPPNYPAWLFENYDSTYVALGPDTVDLCDVGGSYALNALNPGATYLWSTGDTSQSIVVTTTGTYSVTVTGPCGVGTDQIVVSPCCTSTSSAIQADACNSYTAPWGVSYTQSGVYSDTLINASGCDSIINLTLNITGFPMVNASSVSGTCGQPNGTATATATGGSGNYAYTWSNGATGSFISGLSSGSYSVIATDQNGCSSTSQVVVSTSPAAGVTLIAGDTIIGLNESATLEIVGGDTYNWSPALGLNCTDCPTVIASPQSSTTYTVTGTDSIGCSYIRLVNVVVDIICGELFVPNIFSPNGIGNPENEKLCLYSNCIKSMNFGIYNRWGELIFSTDNQNDCWDGTHKGVPVMTGVYTYRLFVEQLDGEKIERSGNITLTR